MNPFEYILFALHRFMLFVIHITIIVRRWWRRTSDRIPLEKLLELKEQNHFSRLPKHLAFITNTEDMMSITLENLAKLASWSIHLKIPYISLYEPNGVYKNNQRLLSNLIENELLRQGVPQNDLQVKHDVTNNECVILINSEQTRIKFLSVEDGKPMLAEVIRELVKKRLITYNNNLPADAAETHPSEITEALKKRWDYPEPDYAIICSLLYSVHGYPPWHLRYTEVSLLNHPHDVTVEAFYQQLCRFAKIQQRFGA